jgi:hypothetical protein
VNDTRFYVELPADEYGNTSMDRAVIEGRIVQGGPDAAPFTSPARKALLFTAPADLADRHGGQYVDAYGGYAEVEGPARMLSDEEYATLIETVRTTEPTGDPR